jgi:hypothetical protein
MLSNFYTCAFPDHPAPAAIEADGKTYVACSTPDTGRGWFHSTYYADFKDNNGQTISLRGIEKLAVTNLPTTIDAPMPSNPVDGKAYREGAEYSWADGTKAKVENGKWVPVKIKNTLCESDDDREKREARRSAAREAEQKKEASELEARQKKEAAELAIFIADEPKTKTRAPGIKRNVRLQYKRVPALRRLSSALLKNIRCSKNRGGKSGGKLSFCTAKESCAGRSIKNCFWNDP